MPLFLVQNIISHGYYVPTSYHTNFYSKILNWVNRFVQARFLNDISRSSLVECLLLTPRFPGSNPETGEFWEEEESFIDCVLWDKRAQRAQQIFQMLSDYPIAYSLEPTIALTFRGGPIIIATWPTYRLLLLKCESNLIYNVEPSF